MFEQNLNNVTSIDQASSLRRIYSADDINVIAVTGGKGGVGKTNIAINLSIAFANMQKNVTLLDADFGLSNVDVMLGLNTQQNLQHVINNDCSIEEIIIKGPHGINIIPAAPGVKEMSTLSAHQHLGIIDSISQLKMPIDYFVIDTAAGISESVCQFTQIANRILVVVCDEPASIADAYGLIKVLCKKELKHKFSILTNMVESSAHGEQLFSQLERVSNHFLNANLEYCGYIPQDDYLKKAIKKQQPVIDRYPSSRSALGFRRVARSIDSKQKISNSNGSVELFLERQLIAQNINQI